MVYLSKNAANIASANGYKGNPTISGKSGAAIVNPVMDAGMFNPPTSQILLYYRADLIFGYNTIFENYCI